MLICAESAGRRETLQQYFNEYDLDLALVDGFEGFAPRERRLALGVAPLQAGFELCARRRDTWSSSPRPSCTPAPAAAPASKKQEARTQVESMVRDLSELKIGDPVVHINHGIGRYMGLISMDLGEGDTEFLHLEYAKETKLYVPVSQLHVISRYSRRLAGRRAAARARLAASGTRPSARPREQVRDTAAELLNLYARRAARQGHAFEYSAHDYENFAAELRLRRDAGPGAKPSTTSSRT